MKRIIPVLLMILCLIPFHFSSADGSKETELKELMSSNTGWLSEDDLSGYADFMLQDGERWVNLGLFEDGIIGVTQDSEGSEGLRIAGWDGTDFGEVIASPMWKTGWSLNEYHSVNDSLELMTVHSNLYVYRCDDGHWRLTGVNNGLCIYTFTDGYMRDETNGMGDCSNDYWHYGRMTLPLDLETLDIDSLPWRGTELVALLDADGWACVRESNTPVYSAPGGDIIAYGYARLAGTIVSEEDSWVCLQIGSEACGMQVWFSRDAKSSIRSKVEHVFAVVKGMFRYRKTRLRGLPKVDAQLHMLFALANLILADRPSVTA